MSKRHRTAAVPVPVPAPVPAGGAPRTPTAADLEAVRDSLRAEIREARGVLSDIRAAIKAGEKHLAETIDAKVGARVEVILEGLGVEVAAQIARSEQMVYQRFDTLVDNVLRDSQRWRGKGETPMREILAMAHASGNHKPGDIPRMATTPNLREEVVEDDRG